MVLDGLSRWWRERQLARLVEPLADEYLDAAKAQWFSSSATVDAAQRRLAAVSAKLATQGDQVRLRAMNRALDKYHAELKQRGVSGDPDMFAAFLKKQIIEAVMAQSLQG